MIYYIIFHVICGIAAWRLFEEAHVRIGDLDQCDRDFYILYSMFGAPSLAAALVFFVLMAAEEAEGRVVRKRRGSE